MRNDSFDDMFHQITSQLVDADLLRVLHGDDDCVNAQRNARTFLHPVLTGHLRTAPPDYNYNNGSLYIPLRPKSKTLV